MGRYNILLTGFLAVFFGNLAYGQDIELTLGPDEIGENQSWTITATVKNGPLRSYENFPDITGFRKRGTSTRSETSIVNGQVSSSSSVVMTYTPTQRGTFTVPPFEMQINGSKIPSPGKKVTVGLPAQAQQSNDPFSRFLNRNPTDDFFNRGNTEFVNVTEDALLALSTSRDEVYIGEGFTATLSFLVADENRAPMQFYELGRQLSDILKELRPATCWEENFNIENIEAVPIQINGKRYSQYKIYQATFYPLNTKPVTFPSVDLEMIKYRVARNPSFFGQNRQEDFKTFSSKPKTVRVKELPPHPMRDAVSVGDYRLEERMGTMVAKTGQSISYEFNVYGEGNISAIHKPTVVRDTIFDFYEPNIRQNLERQNGRVTGKKSFSYFIIPKEPGEFIMNDYFSWIFFNPRTEKYDTLHSRQILTIEGESQQNQTIEDNEIGSFYDRIDTADNTLRSTSPYSWMTFSTNAFILLMLGASVYLIFKK